MNQTAEGCVGRARVVGFFYCAVPTVAYWVSMTSAVPEYRPVYTLRLILALVVGGVAAALICGYATRLWLIKQASADGPATVVDGAIIGGAAGAGMNFIPPLTALIGTQHPEEARLFIIWAWVVSMLVGMVGGALCAAKGCPACRSGS